MNMSESSINLDYNKKTFVQTKLDSIFIPILKKKLSDTAVFNGIEENNINNFITHITFKGKVFYNAIINNPDLSLYLCTQFYPIYDWILPL
jgi:predicted phosphoadenosine phosphosulfate sulfurtransferase